MSVITLQHAECVAAMRKLPARSGGTMAVACQGLGRDCITFECDEETYNKAQRRIKESGKQQQLIPASMQATPQAQLGWSGGGIGWGRS